MIDVTSVQQATPTSAATVKGPNQTLDQDQFLKLLLAQLKHQDPLNPVDNTQFIAQLAQFSQLEQTKQMSSALSKFVTQQNVSNNSSLVGLVGRRVSAAGSSVALTPGTSAPLSYSLAGEASAVTVQVSTAAGLPVRAFELKGQPAGPQTIAWDGKDQNGNTLPAGTYAFAVKATTGKDTPVAATTLQTGQVTAVTFADGIPKIVLNNGQSVAPSQILEVR
jgi:flagellar basal-body rod modification protein FlgD